MKNILSGFIGRVVNEELYDDIICAFTTEEYYYDDGNCIPVIITQNENVDGFSAYLDVENSKEYIFLVKNNKVIEVR